jgi:hypothetical protein
LYDKKALENSNRKLQEASLDKKVESRKISDVIEFEDKKTTEIIYNILNSTSLSNNIPTDDISKSALQKVNLKIIDLLTKINRTYQDNTILDTLLRKLHAFKDIPAFILYEIGKRMVLEKFEDKQMIDAGRKW